MAASQAGGGCPANSTSSPRARRPASAHTPTRTPRKPFSECPAPDPSRDPAGPGTSRRMDSRPDKTPSGSGASPSGLSRHSPEFSGTPAAPPPSVGRGEALRVDRRNASWATARRTGRYPAPPETSSRQSPSTGTSPSISIPVRIARAPDTSARYIAAWLIASGSTAERKSPIDPMCAMWCWSHSCTVGARKCRRRGAPSKIRNHSDWYGPISPRITVPPQLT